MSREKLHSLLAASILTTVITLPAVPYAAPTEAPASGHQKMKALDKDGDGKISRAEAAAAPRLAKRFDVIDADKDGFVTLEEMKTARAKAVAVMFKRVDSNNDGRISKAEADAKAPRLAKHFATVDTNKDGYLSKEELASARKKMAERR